MSKQNKQRAKQLTRNAEDGPRDRHLEAQSRMRLCVHCHSTRVEHYLDGQCRIPDTMFSFEPSAVSIRLSRRAKQSLRMVAKANLQAASK